MGYETVEWEKKESIGILTLHRPDSLNAINELMCQELLAVLNQVNHPDEGIRVLLITGAGRAFCTGMDLKEYQLGARTGEAYRQWHRHFGIQDVVRTLYNLEIPTIAMVNGNCVGAGLDLALACDMRVGSNRARFMAANVRVGFIPDDGGTYLLPKTVGMAKACELVFSADFLEAEEALRIGLINILTTETELEAKAIALASKITRNAPLAIKLAKLHMRRGLVGDLGSALEGEAEAQTILVSSEDHAEGVRAFLENRQPVFKGR